MSLWKSIRRHWFSTALYVAFSAFFLVASVVSVSTYVSVVDAHERIVLADPTHGASVQPNGTLLVSFSVDIVNPSRYDLSLYSVNWEVDVVNGTSGPGWIIPVAGEYWGLFASPVVPARSYLTLSYAEYVSDPSTLSRLRGFVNYSSSIGLSMTLETIPYHHRLVANGWLEDFNHDYLREFYLNDLVRVVLDYDSRWWAL